MDYKSYINLKLRGLWSVHYMQISITNNNSFQPDNYSVGGAEYDSGSINSMDVNWISGSVYIVESEDSKLSFYENLYGKEVKDEERLHWCICAKRLFLSATKPGISVVTTVKKDLKLYVPKNMKIVFLNVVGSSVNYTNITANKLKISGTDSKFDFSFLKCEELNVNGVNHELNIVLFDNLGATVKSNGICSGFIGKKKEMYGDGRVKIKIDGVNIRHSIKME